MWEPFSAKTRKVPGKPRQGGQHRACDCVLSRKEEKGSLVLRGRGKEMACETEKKVSGCGSLESVVASLFSLNLTQEILGSRGRRK